MTPLLKKLNFKEQTKILVLNSPESFKSELKSIENHTLIIQNYINLNDIEFAIVFVISKSAIDDVITRINKKLKGDCILWLCYPKTSSKKYKCDINRDTGWATLGKFNFEPVRQIAIDEDWSALRFRKIEFIKKITRRETMALTTEAKKRTSQKNK